jgi:hypothetical protein
VPTASSTTPVKATSTAFAVPTVNDFLARIDRPIDKAIEKAQLAAEQAKRDAARTGQTGNSVAKIFEVVKHEFDAAVHIVLRDLGVCLVIIVVSPQDLPSGSSILNVEATVAILEHRARRPA